MFDGVTNEVTKIHPVPGKDGVFAVVFRDGRQGEVINDPKYPGQWKYWVRKGEWSRAGHGYRTRQAALDDAARGPDKRFN